MRSFARSRGSVEGPAHMALGNGVGRGMAGGRLARASGAPRFPLGRVTAGQPPPPQSRGAACR
ncbi:MAG: hypothetical protein OXU61_03420 [Gammaproteobacteria bacterium]|nr:hypothetical protein [Gammaproteobacteria bacterium]